MRKARISLLVCGVLFVVTVVAFFGTRQHLHNKAGEQVGAIVAALPWLSDITYQKLQMAPLRGDIHLRQVRLFISGYTEPLEIGDCTIRRLKEMPQAGLIVVDNFKVPREHPLVHKLKFVLEAMGYDDIHVQAELDYHYIPQQRRFVLDRLQIGAKDLGELQTRVVLENIDPAQLYAARDQRFFFLMLLSNVSLVEGRLTYTDASLVQRLLNLIALMQGQTIQAYRLNLLNDLTLQILHTKDPGLQGALAALREFIETPGSIDLRVTPEKPIPLLGLLWPRDRVGLLESLRLEVN